jgi:hypothetical protein
MLEDALGYLSDANTLARKMPAPGAGAQPGTRVLALEILLKCAEVVCGISPEPNHDYREHWSRLPPDAQRDILDAAKARMPGHAPGLDDLTRILKAYERVFIQGRYPYEFNAGKTPAQITRRTNKWLSKGSRPETADIAYYPMELDCLIHGLRQYIEPRLPPRPSP